MNIINNEILSAIDNIDDCVMEAELAVIDAMYDVYEKSCIILEHCDRSTITMFQESNTNESLLNKLKSLPSIIINALINVFQKFVNIITCNKKSVN